MRKRDFFPLAITIGIGFLAMQPALAQDQWPDGPVTIVVPYDAGGTTDNMTRVIADQMQAQLGVPVIVTNTAGGGGVVGMAQALNSKPDGQTVGMYLSNTLVGIATGATPFSREAIQPACMFSEAPLTITVNGDESAPQDLQALLEMTDASLAIERGTLSQFAGMMINETSQHDLKLVNAGTGPEKNTAVMGGHITALLTPTAGVMPQHEAGQLKVLAVLANDRLSIAPELPTAKEQGLDVSMVQSNGFMFPSGTPSPIVSGFCDALKKAVDTPEVSDRFDALNVETHYLSGQKYVDYMSSQLDTIQSLAESVGYAR